MQEEIKNKNKTIILVAVIIILLSILAAGYFLWFKNKTIDINLNQELDTKLLEDKFNLDLFENQSFLELQETPSINMPANQNLGKENPFLEFD